MPKSRLKPLRPNTTQVARILKQDIGSGFLLYRLSETEVEAVEFKMGSDGAMLNLDGTPLEYVGLSGGLQVHYRIVVEPIGGA